jgi:hypothetical protein
MTGRELILYILSNGLENEPVFNGETFVGYITAERAAVKMKVGYTTIRTLVDLDMLDGIWVGNKLYIAANSIHPVKSNKE